MQKIFFLIFCKFQVICKCLNKKKKFCLPQTQNKFFFCEVFRRVKILKLEFRSTLLNRFVKSSYPFIYTPPDTDKYTEVFEIFKDNEIIYNEIFKDFQWSAHILLTRFFTKLNICIRFKYELNLIKRFLSKNNNFKRFESPETFISRCCIVLFLNSLRQLPQHVWKI